MYKIHGCTSYESDDLTFFFETLVMSCIVHMLIQWSFSEWYPDQQQAASPEKLPEMCILDHIYTY